MMVLYPCGIHDSADMPGQQGDPCDFPPAEGPLPELPQER